MIRLTYVAAFLGFVLALFGGYWITGGQAQTSKAPPKSTPATKQADARPEKAKEPALAKFMRAKLNASSHILEGLCTEDYESIQKGAEKLKSMSNEERWRVSNDAVYRQHSAEFRDAVDNILTAAKEKKNLDTAALAWTKTTLSCIECHRWVRNTLVAE
jgi:hypothetical protein